MLAPSAKVGFFVSTTGGDQSSIARSELVASIVQRLFPTVRAPLWSGARGTFNAGFYRSNRRSYSKPVEGADLSSWIKVTAHGDHGVVTEISGDKVYWEQIGSRVYRQVTGGTSMGPLGKLEFHGEGADARMSFETQPHVLYRLVR